MLGDPRGRSFIVTIDPAATTSKRGRLLNSERSGSGATGTRTLDLLRAREALSKIGSLGHQFDEWGILGTIAALCPPLEGLY